MTGKKWFVADMLALLALVAGGLVHVGLARDPETAALTSQHSIPQSQRAGERIVRGTVKEVEGAKVRVETPSAAVATLVLTRTTRFWVPGEPLTTTMDLAVGDPVLVVGGPLPIESESGGTSLSARLIVVVGEEDLPKVLIRGQAVAITRQTIIVRDGRRERAITLLPRTRVWPARGGLAALQGLRPGQRVVALGQPTALGQWVAGTVLLPRAKPR